MRKIITIFVIVAFAWTVQLAAAPVSSSSEKAAPGTADGTGAVEKAIARPTPVKKSPLVPILIGVAAAAVIALVLILVAFKTKYKTKYDITGNWSVSMVQAFSGDIRWPATFNCSGDKESGNAVYKDTWGTMEGTYSVSDKSVSLIFYYPGGGWQTITGTFTEADAMKGNWSNTDEMGTWKAKKGVSSAAQPKKSGQKTGAGSPLLEK